MTFREARGTVVAFPLCRADSAGGAVILVMLKAWRCSSLHRGGGTFRERVPPSDRDWNWGARLRSRGVPAPTASAPPCSRCSALTRPLPTPKSPQAPRSLYSIYHRSWSGARPAHPHGDWLRTRKDRALASRPLLPMGAPAWPDGRASFHQWGLGKARSCGPGERV